MVGAAVHPNRVGTAGSLSRVTMSFRSAWVIVPSTLARLPPATKGYWTHWRALPAREVWAAADADG